MTQNYSCPTLKETADLVGLLMAAAADMVGLLMAAADMVDS